MTKRRSRRKPPRLALVDLGQIHGLDQRLAEVEGLARRLEDLARRQEAAAERIEDLISSRSDAARKAAATRKQRQAQAQAAQAQGIESNGNV